jgi:hypothetical protein
MNYSIPMTEEAMAAKIAQATELVKSMFVLAPAIAEYSNRSSFLRSLFDQINQGKTLTANQIHAANGIISQYAVRDLQNQGEMSEAVGFVVQKQEVRSKYVEVGDIITVNHPMAVKFGLQAGFQKKVHNVEVLEVIGEDYGAIRVKVVTCYKRVSNCTCCGLKLKDPQSVAIGIGPVCAKGRNVKNIEDLALALGKAEFTIRIPKSMIKSIFKNTVDQTQAA